MSEDRSAAEALSAAAQDVLDFWDSKPNCKTIRQVRDGLRVALDRERAAALPTIDPSYCDCNYEPIRGIKAGRHLPSCRYGIIEDWLDSPAIAQEGSHCDACSECDCTHRAEPWHCGVVSR
jgi:hypothetical protein